MAARRKIFIEKVAEHVPISSTHHCAMDFSYDDAGTLTVYRDGKEKAWRHKVKVGDSFCVNINDGQVTLHRLEIPRRKADLLMWLLSYKGANRTYDIRQYRDLISDQRVRCGEKEYIEQSIDDYLTTHDDSYAFTIFSDDTGSVRRVAAMVSQEPNKAMVKEVLLQWSRRLRLGLLYPRPFVESLLRSRFGFTDEDLDDIRGVKYWQGH